MLCPIDTDYELSTGCYKQGVHGYIYIWSEYSGWIKSSKTKKELLRVRARRSAEDQVRHNNSMWRKKKRAGKGKENG